MGERAADPVDDKALERAKAVLSRTFSLILLTEKLGDFGPLVQKTLGWTASDFSPSARRRTRRPTRGCWRSRGARTGARK